MNNKHNSAGLGAVSAKEKRVGHVTVFLRVLRVLFVKVTPDP